MFSRTFTVDIGQDVNEKYDDSWYLDINGQRHGWYTSFEGAVADAGRQIEGMMKALR